MNLSFGIVGLLVTAAYAAVTGLGLAIMVVGLIVLINVNRLLTRRLRGSVMECDHG